MSSHFFRLDTRFVKKRIENGEGRASRRSKTFNCISRLESMILQKRKRNNEPPEINEILELKASCKRNVGLK